MVDGYTEYIVTNDGDKEYFCQSCCQLRLWCKPQNLVNCGNCGSTQIIIGAPGSLDKEALKRQFGKPGLFNSPHEE